MVREIHLQKGMTDFLCGKGRLGDLLQDQGTEGSDEGHSPYHSCWFGRHDVDGAAYVCACGVLHGVLPPPCHTCDTTD